MTKSTHSADHRLLEAVCAEISSTNELSSNYTETLHFPENIDLLRKIKINGEQGRGLETQALMRGSAVDSVAENDALCDGRLQLEFLFTKCSTNFIDCDNILFTRSGRFYERTARPRYHRLHVPGTFDITSFATTRTIGVPVMRQAMSLNELEPEKASRRSKRMPRMLNVSRVNVGPRRAGHRPEQCGAALLERNVRQDVGQISARNCLHAVVHDRQYFVRGLFEEIHRLVDRTHQVGRGEQVAKPMLRCVRSILRMLGAFHNEILCVGLTGKCPSRRRHLVRVVANFFMGGGMGSRPRRPETTTRSLSFGSAFLDPKEVANTWNAARHLGRRLTIPQRLWSKPAMRCLRVSAG